MDKLKKVLVGNDSSPSEEVNFAAQLADSTSLSWSTRVQGFVICFVLGFVLSALGISLLMLPIAGGPIKFAVLYSLGNVMSICSTLFLMGPMKQLKKMFNETRYLATLAMLAFLALTFIAAHKGKVLLCFIFCILQFLSMAYYSLSYIPFARDAVRRAATSII